MKSIAEWLDTDDQMCIDIVDRKYLLGEDILGHKETIDEMLDRVSGGNIKARELMEKRKFIPGGRIIANRGLQKHGLKVTYSNCYVISPPEDNIESIYQTCSNLARTFSYGGGCGIDISKLAPKGAKVNNSAKNSTGAISFVDTFSNVSETIGQNGRRGALMISLDARHPDAIDFITHKSDLEITQGANMSLRVDKDFFEAVKNDDDWVMEFSRPETNNVITKTTEARDLLNLIAKTNWDYAEPGLLYWDTICNYNLMSNDPNFSYAGTNPCGEEPLPSGGSCLLGAMNLSEYWRANNRFAFVEFYNDVKIAVKFLNEVLDEGGPLHPLVEQRRTVSELRQIGLGFMGLGDLFIKAKMRYGSEASIKLVDKIGSHMIIAALEASNELAKETEPFDLCDPQCIVSSEFYRNNVDNNLYVTERKKRELTQNILKYGLRNSQLLTCAPTGTTSTIFNVSGGIEPVFALEFARTTKSIYDEDRTYLVHPKAVQDYLKSVGKENLSELEEFPDFLVTARDIGWKERIDVQAAWQEHIDASISATINLPESTTVEEVAELYMYAHEAGLKGTTVFRENCKRIAILNDSFKKKDDIKEETKDESSFVAKEILEKAIEGTGIPRDIVLGKSDDSALEFIEKLIKYQFRESSYKNKSVGGTASIDNNTEIVEFINSFYDDIACKYKDKYAIFATKENILESLKMIKSIVDVEYALNHNSSSDEIEESHDKWCKDHNCHYNPNECTLEHKFPDCTDNLEDKKAIRGLNCPCDCEESVVGGRWGAPDNNSTYINAIKNKFKSNFSDILTRADFSSALHGTTYYKRVACGHIYITVNRYQGRPVEVFMQSSKSGGCSANTEALGRMASTMLRAGIDPDIVVDSVFGVKCAACSAIKGKGEDIDGLSCSDVMARVIKEEYQKYKDGEYDDEIIEWLSTASYEEKWKLLNPNISKDSKVDVCIEPYRYDNNKELESSDASFSKESMVKWNYKDHTAQENIDNYICPDCGSPLTLSEGCMKCINCGFSKC